MTVLLGRGPDSMLADLRSYILADATVSGLIAARFYLDKLPQNPTYPACEYGMVDESVMNTHSDSSTLNRDIVQIDVYAKKAVQALNVKEAIKSRLNGAAVTQGTTIFGYIEWQGADSGYEPEIELFRQMISISILWSPV